VVGHSAGAVKVLHLRHPPRHGRQAHGLERAGATPEAHMRAAAAAARRRRRGGAAARRRRRAAAAAAEAAGLSPPSAAPPQPGKLRSRGITPRTGRVAATASRFGRQVQLQQAAGLSEVDPGHIICDVADNTPIVWGRNE